MIALHIAPYVIIQMATLRYKIVLVLALLLACTYSQDATADTATEPPASTTPTQDTPVAPESNPPPASTPEPTPSPPPADTPATPADTPATPTTEDYMVKIQKIREEVAQSTTLDHKYLEKKIQEVIGSMTPEQKENFEGKLSADARAAYEKYKKSRDEEAQKQNQETANFVDKTQISEQQKILQDESLEMKQLLTNFKGRRFTDYQFELPSQSSEDIQFTLPIEQDVVLFSRVFTNTDGVYSTVKNINKEEPIWLYIYENNDRLVQQVRFHSLKVINFQGKANASYLLRYTNHGSDRLVAFYLGNILLDAHVGTKLTAVDMADHQTRMQGLKQQLYLRITDQRSKLVLQGQNEKSLLKGLDHYYFYNIGEIVLLGIICVIQVESIRKLLVASSVV